MIVKKNFDVSEFNSYRVKSLCKRVYFPQTETDIATFFRNFNHEFPVVLGAGFNTLLSKSNYERDFIVFADNFSNISIDENIIVAQSGATLYNLSELAYKHSLSGLEMFYDIPSSMGGAVVMNAGAGGEEIKDILQSVRYFNPNLGTFHDVNTVDIGFKYRDSLFQRNPQLIVVSATLKLMKGDQTFIREKMDNIKAARWAKQPKEYPNAGSVFKRPEGKFVGPMIEELGLKGFSIGGAKVSEKHAGFIVNYNDATGDDIVGLIEYIKQKVYDAYGITLEVEQRIV